MKIDDSYFYLPESNLRSSTRGFTKNSVSSNELLRSDSVQSAMAESALRRTGQIDRVRNEVRQGTYTVNAEAVSSSMIDRYLDSESSD